MRNAILLLMLCFTTLAFADPPSRIRFVGNRNQWNCDIYFAAGIPGGNMLLTNTGFRYVFIDGRHIEEMHDHAHSASSDFSEATGSPDVKGVIVNVAFMGANKHSIPAGSIQTAEYYNFFIGNDPGRWASEVYGYHHVRYPQLYNGIDLRVYSAGDHVKYDLVVAQNANPGDIRIQYEGAEKLWLDNGNLYVKTELGEIIERRPLSYQIIDGFKCTVPSEFILQEGILSFDFPEGYDSCYELVIDPLLIFSTYSGSTADNWGSTATPGEKGNVYSAGVTNHYVGAVLSGTFPATTGSFQTTYGGLYDIGILKYDSLGKTLLYASYLGGAESESPHSLVMNQQHELIVLGTTGSSDFPTSGTAYDRTFNGGTAANHVVSYRFGSDITVSRISADGKTLLGSTYLGGSNNDGLNLNALARNYGDQLRGDVATDANGNIYISSVTSSIDIGAGNPYGGSDYDAIVVKMPASLATVSWIRYVGGNGIDAAHTIKLDSENNIVVAGGTSSTDFPVTAGAFQTTYSGEIDGWIARLDNQNGNIRTATYTGTAMYDQVYILDLNRSDEVYVFGQTTGDKQPSPGLYGVPNSGQFIQKFNKDLSKEAFYTVFGSGKGTPDISPTAFMVSDCNYLYMSGWGGSLNLALSGAFSTSTFNLPVTNDALQKTTSGHDFYFIVLAEEAKELLYATFLGGNVSQTHVDGGTSRFDKKGIVYHAVCAGCRSGRASSSSDFPTTSGVHSRTNKSLNCNNVAFKFDLSSLRAALSLRGSDKICLPDVAVFDNLSIGGEVFVWDFGDGSPPVTRTQLTAEKHEYKKPGTYKVWLKTIDQGTCIGRDSASITVQVAMPLSQFPDDATICSGASHTLVASGGAEYTWRSHDGKYVISGPQNQISVAPRDSTLFYITITETSGCVRYDSAWVNVIPLIKPEFDFSRKGDCSENFPALVIKNTTDSLWAADRFLFDFGDGNTSDLDEVTHLYEDEGLYNVRLIAIREFCVSEKAVPMAYGKVKYPNVMTPGVKEGLNDVFMIQFGKIPGKTPLDYGLKTEVTIYDRWGRPVFESDDYRHDWSGENVTSGVYYYQVTVQDHQSCKNWVHVIK
jgi:hypothetical protein